MTITTILAADRNAEGDAIALEGFDPLNPQLVPIGNELFFGRSGMVYPATTSLTTTVGQLAGLLGAGFDLSAFDGSDPNRIVYVSQVNVPVSDFAIVPEPSSLTLLGLVAWQCLATAGAGERGRFLRW